MINLCMFKKQSYSNTNMVFHSLVSMCYCTFTYFSLAYYHMVIHTLNEYSYELNKICHLHFGLCSKNFWRKITHLLQYLQCLLREFTLGFFSEIWIILSNKTIIFSLLKKYLFLQRVC